MLIDVVVVVVVTVVEFHFVVVTVVEFDFVVVTVVEFHRVVVSDSVDTTVTVVVRVQFMMLSVMEVACKGEK